MHKSLKRKATRIGLSPGSLIPAEGVSQMAAAVRLIRYSPATIEVIDQPCLAECQFPSEGLIWIEIVGTQDIQLIETIGKHFGLHSLVLEDILSSGQPCKMDNFDDYLFVVLHALTYDNNKKESHVEQVSLVLGKNYVLSFVETTKGLFDPVLERLKKDASRLRSNGSDYLCYALIDCTVDHYFEVLAKIDDQLELLEQDVVKEPVPSTVVKIQHAKRMITQLRKSIWPMREVISQFRRSESPLIKPATDVYMRDVYDHTIQAIDAIESFRDLTSGLMDIYLSTINQRMNEIMKVLTVVATIFVPITFIASLYGMNFDYMPELHSPYGYPMALSGMSVVIIIMLSFFHHRRWI